MANVKTYDGTGADCSGSSYDSNRVLTLSNTGLTRQSGFLVYASGLALGLTTEYTVSHKSSSTEITFLNPLTDTMTIIVQYYEQATDQYAIMRNDFQEIIEEHGQNVTLIRQTETVASMGDVTNISEEEWTIITMIRDIIKKDRQIHEMGLAIPGNSKAYLYHEYPDSITGNGSVIVKAGDMIKDVDNKYWRIEQIIGERRAQAKEIFRTAIIKSIDLNQ